MSADTEDEAQERRPRYRVTLAIGTDCYVLAVITGMFLLEDDFGSGLLVPLWIVHWVLLVVLIRKLGAAGDSSATAALFIVCTSLPDAGPGRRHR
ncbi:hypothetical protein ACFYO0_29055 [Streptomyces sp. NPDC006365]|uniref:hypothetical protein n=1 Tax=Streptomyces sp. NPDC006365 TaxID=3364744 RepID=UPI00367FDBAB